ncbi:single-stranded DNA-binding protein [Staphylococcus haemolyticus]|jgi:single-strand DNA-binding protein|uniref:single-stranded DNA-binding protein n=1 Tax=Staphylococcus haemolyticus TaxID=1283 RepID=UPI00069ED060|nr:single-stranded DNA-binding protein [Staphylococcus haemolyticus]
MINRVVLVGRLTKDPNFNEGNVANAKFTLAVNRPYKNKNGEQEADFINVVAFRRQAENVNNYLSKGQLAGVDGRIQTRSYEKDGQRVYVTEVVADSVQFLEPKNNNQQNNQPQQQKGQAPTGNNPFANANGPIDISDDDLPF